MKKKYEEQSRNPNALEDCLDKCDELETQHTSWQDQLDLWTSVLVSQEEKSDSNVSWRQTSHIPKYPRGNQEPNNIIYKFK